MSNKAIIVGTIIGISLIALGVFWALNGQDTAMKLATKAPEYGNQSIAVLEIAQMINTQSTIIGIIIATFGLTIGVLIICKFG